MSGSEKSGREHVRYSSIKRVTTKFLEVSRCSRGKQRQRNLQKKCAARAEFLLLIRPIVVFHRFPALQKMALSLRWKRSDFIFTIFYVTC